MFYVVMKTLPAFPLRRLLVAACACACFLLLWPAAGQASLDYYGHGNGHEGPVTVTGRTVLNHVAPLANSAAPGDVQLTTAPGRTGASGTPSSGGSAAQTQFEAGRVVMVLQSVGALAGAQSGAPGPFDISDDQLGRWELGRIASISGDVSSGMTITLDAPLENGFTAPGAQVIAVPEFSDIQIQAFAGWQALPWDGASGGVTAFLTEGTVMMNDPTSQIDADSAGFRGGIAQPGTGSGCAQLDGPIGGGKGEGVLSGVFPGDATTNASRGNLANGGGGGDCQYAGGGGGAGAGAGGLGGNSEDGARNVGGLGGSALTYPALDHATFGGGGGAGDGVGGAGGAGGGLVFIRAAAVTGDGVFSADGARGGSTSVDAGAGGGGAGGVVYMRIAGPVECGTLRASGGAGGDVLTPFGLQGPGGGGGGGRILLQSSGGTCDVNAGSGVAGTAVNNGSSSNGAQPASPNDPLTTGTVDSPPPGALAEPTASLEQPANGITTANPLPTISGSSTTTSSWVRLTLDGQAHDLPTTPSGAWTFTPDESLGDGPHSFSVRAVAFAIAGPQSPSRSFTVDTTPPAPPTVSSPKNGAFVNTATPKVYFTSDQGTSTKCATDGGSLLFCSSPLTTPPLADGSHSVTIEAKDLAGNTATTVVTFTVDTARPVLTMLGTPEGGDFTSDLSASFSFSANEPAQFECALDSWNFSSCTSPAAFTLPAPADGAHRFSVRAIDAAGNYSLLASRSWTIDTLAPNAPQIISPTDSAAVQSAAPTIGGSSEPYAQIEVTVDDQPDGTATSEADGSWSVDTTQDLPDAEHTFAAKATDRAGNVSPVSAPVTVRIDAAIPTATIESEPAPVASRSSATFNFVADESATFECSVDGSPARACSPPVVTSGLGDGTHSFSLVAIDASGNRSPATVSSWVVDTTAPAVTITQSSPPPLASPIFSFSADEPVSSFKCRIDGLGGFSGCSSPFAAPPLSVGEHKFELRATDIVGNLSQRLVNFTVTPLPLPPSLLPPPPVVTPTATPPTTCNAVEGLSGVPATASLRSVRVGRRSAKFSLTLDRTALVELAVQKRGRALASATALLRRGRRSLSLQLSRRAMQAAGLEVKITALTANGGRSGATAPLAGGNPRLETSLDCGPVKGAAAARVAVRARRGGGARSGRATLEMRSRDWALVTFQLTQQQVNAGKVLFLRPNRWTRVALKSAQGQRFGRGRAFVQLKATGLDGLWRTTNRTFPLY